jgi:enoyl-CoA hydratase
MIPETLRYEVEDGIAVVTLNRPDKLNALSREVLDELEACFVEVGNDDVVRGIILTGAGGKAFAAGADIAEFRAMTAMDGHRFALRGQAVFNRIASLRKPVIAAVNGFALGGGCELAISCHLRTASENASFGQPEVNLGIIPGYGGTQRLPRLIGLGMAMEMILTGERISARRALDIGLINRLYPDDTLIDGTKELLQSITSKAPAALGLAIEALHSSDMPLHEGLRYEATLFGQCCATEDFSEGIDAFLTRRKPEFKGR